MKYHTRDTSPTRGPSVADRIAEALRSADQHGATAARLESEGRSASGYRRLEAMLREMADRLSAPGAA